MIKVFNLRNGKTINITGLCQGITISGSISDVARKLELQLLFSVIDDNHKRYSLPLGSKVWVTLEGKEIFRGIVWGRDFSSENELDITAYDYLIYLTKSKITHNFKRITAEDAVREICNELGVAVGSLAATGVQVKRLISQQTGYDAIMTLYRQAAKQTGKKYISEMSGGKLNIISKGTTVSKITLTPNANLISNTYTDTLDNMINQVKIYNDKNKYIGKVENINNIKAYGLLQENYTKEKDVNANTAAKNLLNGVDRELDVECLGDWSCRTGYAVSVDIRYLSKLKNKIMYIDSDSHTWEPGTSKYTMQLTLNFANEMDEEG